MASTTNQAPRATNFVNLSYFRIYVNWPLDSNPRVSLYRNGLQQCKINVGFIAVDSQNRQIVLTPSEIGEAVRLIRYDGGSQIEHGSGFWPPPPEWYSSFTERGFVWEPSSMAAAQALQDDVDKVLAGDFDIDELTAFRGDKSTRIRSLTSTSHEHHWDKEFFRGMVAECRRQADAPAKELPSSAPEPYVVPNDHPLLGSLPDGEPEGLQDGAQVVTFLVLTSSSSSLAIAATIRSSTGLTFRTNHIEVHDPNGLGNGRGQFNSQVMVNTLPIPNYPISAFGDFLPVVDNDWVLQDRLVYGSNPNLRAYEHYIKLTVDGKPINLRNVLPIVSESTVWNDAGDVGAEWSYSYTGNPGSTLAVHSGSRTDGIGYFRSGNNGNLICDSYQLMRTVAPSGIHQPRSGQVVIGQVMSNDHWQISNWQGNGSRMLSRRFFIQDEYGNDHHLELYLPNGRYKFNYVAIRKQ